MTSAQGSRTSRALRARLSLAFAVAATGVVVDGSVLLADPAYEIQALTLPGGEYERADGYRSSGWVEINRRGDVLGFTSRYIGSKYMGRAAWVAGWRKVTQVGLYGPAYVRADGYMFNDPKYLNEKGEAIGTTYLYRPGVIDEEGLGRTSWFYDGKASREVGLTDKGHVRADGYRDNFGYLLSDNGYVAGSSYRYSGNTYLGQSAWIYRNGVTTEIGYMSPDAYGPGGMLHNVVMYMNDAGQVSGFGARYAGDTYLGHVAWRYSAGTVVDIGLKDSVHTRSDGYREARAERINRGGEVIGTSERYLGAGFGGQTAWIFDGTRTIDIGLHGAGYAKSDGTAISGVYLLSDQGTAVGYSARYKDNADAGEAWWVYDGSTTRRIGLFDAAHTAADGVQRSQAIELNDRGDVIGISEQGGDDRRSAWLDTQGASRKVGLYSGVWAGAAGQSFNTPFQLNASGQVAGDAGRYGPNPTTDYGATAWFYDPKTEITTPIEYKTSKDGRAFTHADFLAEDGTVLGQYVDWDDPTPSYEAYIWTLRDGFRPLGTLLNGGLSQAGWLTLYQGLTGNDVLQLVGRGQFVGELGSGTPLLISEPSEGVLALAPSATPSDIVFMMQPVPEPGTCGLVVSAAAALMVGCRRRGVGSR